MKQTQRYLGGFAMVLAACLASTATAQSNIDPDNALAWGENIGWINLHPSAEDGVVVTDNHLSGFAWGENVGWIWFGDGPDDGVAYTNDGTDHGVNNDGAGNLSGYAWGENIGWILFDTTSVGASQVTIDSETGEFDGMAWGSNVGWINFASGSGVQLQQDTSVVDWMLLDD
ncbi:MAG: hypothetical protein JJU11_17940 [Candidatus Sumerlaeia bacterium]|nr:hypothetical protein [Candidatus Sumerlaeia bacterium]